MEKAASHQSVNWYSYFKSIRTECPWSYSAYLNGQIQISPWQGEILPLGTNLARVYTVSESDQAVEALAKSLDHGEDEWLFSYPGYGEFASPVPILIQQNRALLAELRKKLKCPLEN